MSELTAVCLALGVAICLGVVWYQSCQIEWLKIQQSRSELETELLKKQLQWIERSLDKGNRKEVQQMYMDKALNAMDPRVVASGGWAPVTDKEYGIQEGQNRV